MSFWVGREEPHWKEDWGRQQSKERIQRSVYDKLDRIDEKHKLVSNGAQQAAQMSTKERIFSGNAEEELSKKDSPLRSSDSTCSESATSLLVGGSSYSCDGPSEELSEEHKAQLKRKLLVQNCPELRQLKRKLDAKLVKAEQEIQAMKNRCESKKSKQCLDQDLRAEKSIAEILTEKEDVELNQSVQKENKAKYLDSLKSQIEAKLKNKEMDEKRKLHELEQIKASLKKAEEEKLERKLQRDKMKAELIEGLESKISSRQHNKQAEIEQIAKMEDSIKKYEEITCLRSKELNERKNQAFTERQKLTQTVFEQVAAEVEKNEGKRKVLEEYDHLSEEKKIRQQEQRDQELKRQKHLKWQAEVEKQMECRKQQLERENKETEKIAEELERLEKLQAEEQALSVEERRRNKMRNKELLDQQIAEKRDLLNRQKIIEGQLEQAIGDGEKTLDTFVQEEKDKMMRDFNEQLTKLNLNDKTE